MRKEWLKLTSSPDLLNISMVVLHIFCMANHLLIHLLFRFLNKLDPHLAMHLSGTDAGHVCWMWYFEGFFVAHGWMKRGGGFWTFFFLQDFPKITPKPQWVFGPLRCLQSLFGRRWPLFPTAHKEETALTNALKAQRKLSLVCSLACVESCIKSSLHMLFPLLPNPILWARDQGWWCCNRIYFCQLCQDPSATLSLTRIEGVVKELNFLRMDVNLMDIVTFNVQNPPAAQGRQMNACKPKPNHVNVNQSKTHISAKGEIQPPKSPKCFFHGPMIPHITTLSAQLLEEELRSGEVSHLVNWSPRFSLTTKVSKKIFWGGQWISPIDDPFSDPPTLASFDPPTSAAKRMRQL